jgi:FlaA1/EpsC-like NDP-sugar epimerase
VSRVPVYDIAWGGLSPLLAFFLRDGTIYSPGVVATYCAAALLASLAVFQWFQTASPIVRFYSGRDAAELLKACALVAALSAVTLFLISRLEDAPRAIPILHFFLLGSGLLAVRVAISRRETRRDRPSPQPNKATRHVLIIQASRLAWFFCRMVEELAPGDFQIVAILDERRAMRHRSLHGYLCVHGAYHHWSRLKWLADLNAMLTTTAADVTQLYRHAQKIGAGVCSGQALLLCRRLFDLPLPAAVTAEIERDRRVSRLANIALRAMATPVIVNKPMTGVYTQFLFGRGWRFLTAQCRAASTGMLDIMTLPLPLGLHWLYPALRPALWLWRRVSSRLRR